MKILLGVMSTAAFLFCTCCLAQGLKIENSRIKDGQGGYEVRWDSVQDELLLFRNSRQPLTPAVRVFKADGSDTVIAPVYQLDAAKYVDVWDVAAAPNGAVVIAAGVNYTEPKVKPAQVVAYLLTFNESGKLTKAWATAPFHHTKVAVDEQGNVYAFGLNAGKEPFPLIVKYSPTGSVLKEFFQTSLIPGGEKNIVDSATNGNNRLFIANGKVHLFLGQLQTLFIFSKTGELLSKAELSLPLGQLASQLGNDGRSVRVSQIAPDQNGELLAEVEVARGSATEKTHAVMIHLPPDASKATIVNSADILFLGRSSSGKEVYLSYNPSTNISSVIER